MIRGRAYRRWRHKQLVHKHLSRIVREQSLDLDTARKYAAMRAITPHPCSCPMCGNPRRHFGEKTIQEKRADQMMATQLEIEL